jgi:hypothetical protein
MAKKQIGQTRTVTVKKHKRNIPGRLKPKKIAKHKRRQTYWGAARRIRKKFIYRLDLRFNLKSEKDINRHYKKSLFGSREKFIHTWQKLREIISSGIIGGMQIYEEDFLEFVPQKSGTLRKDLMSSILSNKPKGGKKFKFPYMMRVGVKTKYASVVDKYDQRVQVQHSPGKTRSSGKSYFADKGDPNAEHHFFQKFPRRMHEATREGIEEAANRFGFTYDQVVYFLMDSPVFL